MLPGIPSEGAPRSVRVVPIVTQRSSLNDGVGFQGTHTNRGSILGWSLKRWKNLCIGNDLDEYS